MRALLRLSAAWLLVVALASGARSQTPQTPPVSGAQQTPARDSKAAKVATGVIRGRVTAAGTGAPLGRARLMLFAPVLERPFYTETDAQGRFEFTDLPAGRYTLQAGKSTYVTLRYGQRRAFEAGKPIELAQGATLEKVDITLPRGGVISGTIVDDLGEPLVLGCVTALRSRFEQGKRKLSPIGRDVQTNDLGQFRLFGLEPGTYFVGTCQAFGPPLDSYPFAPSYYPGTFDPSEAQRVVVQLGQERGGVDFVQLAGRLARLSGIVIDPSGRPLARAGMEIISLETGHVMSAAVKPDGSFSIEKVVRGEYMLAAVTPGPRPDDIRETAVLLTVTGDDLAGLVLQTTDGRRVLGRVVTDEGTAPPFSPSGMRVDPSPVPSDLPFTVFNTGQQGVIKGDWTFEMNGIGGSMLFRISRLPAGYMVKSILLDGRDITDQPLAIRGTDDVSGLEVVITSHVTEITGTPRDVNGQPVLDYAVVVFADEAARWKYPSRFIATARPDQQGGFKIPNLPPGRYLAVALEYLEEGQEQDPDYLETLRPLATSFTLSFGERKTLGLKVTKPVGL